MKGGKGATAKKKRAQGAKSNIPEVQSILVRRSTLKKMCENPSTRGGGEARIRRIPWGRVKQLQPDKGGNGPPSIKEWFGR